MKLCSIMGGSDWLHTGWRNGFLCLDRLRIDGFAGYVQENENQEGTITTKSLKFNGQNIKLTADVEKGGRIEVNILDKNGKKISDVGTISNTMTNGLLTMDKYWATAYGLMNIVALFFGAYITDFLGRSTCRALGEGFCIIKRLCFNSIADPTIFSKAGNQ